MYDSSWPREYPIDLGDGFSARPRNSKILEKYDVLGQGSLHFVNTLSTLVDEKKDELPEEDWEALAYALKRFMIDYEGGDLYYYLVHTHGADALNYNAWVHFSLDCVWSVCVRTFTDMPTEVIEEYGVRHWAERNKTIGPEGSGHIMEALNNRTDIYGANGGMPVQMVKGILFNSELADSY
jgi:hypothetical protein